MPCRTANFAGRCSLVEVAGPEVVVLHDEGYNAGLQLGHEGILSYDGVYFRLPCSQVEIRQPCLREDIAASRN